MTPHQCFLWSQLRDPGDLDPIGVTQQVVGSLRYSEIWGRIGTVTYTQRGFFPTLEFLQKTSLSVTLDRSTVVRVFDPLIHGARTSL